MSAEQYANWPAYLRLIEHTWNTTVHTTMGVTPFEAAHGLPAASATSRLATTGDYCEPDTIDQKGITAMQTTAKAIRQILRQQLEQDSRQRTAKANSKGFNHTFKVGDKVSFFIPPTAHEAEELGRKAKHIAHFKGPAIITKKLSPTTYAIKFNGRTYGRCSSELRAYRSVERPNLISTVNNVGTDLKVGNFVALSDTDDPKAKGFKQVHVGKIINIADGQAHIQNYATLSRSMAQAKWAPLYQLPSGVYTTVKPKRNAKNLRVIDMVDEFDQDYVRCADLSMTSSGKISARSRAHLANLGLKHHVLGLTYP